MRHDPLYLLFYVVVLLVLVFLVLKLVAVL